jgi:hypothetical protein
LPRPDASLIGIPAASLMLCTLCLTYTGGSDCRNWCVIWDCHDFMECDYRQGNRIYWTLIHTTVTTSKRSAIAKSYSLQLTTAHT